MKNSNTSVISWNKWPGVLLLGATLFSGCTGIGLMSKQKQCHSSDSFTLETPRTDIFDAITTTGKSLGWNLSAKDIKRRKINFEDTSSNFLVGGNSSTQLELTVGEDYKSVDLNITLGGNFGHGTVENAQKIIDRFKARLQTELAKAKH